MMPKPGFHDLCCYLKMLPPPPSEDIPSADFFKSLVKRGNDPSLILAKLQTLMFSQSYLCSPAQGLCPAG